MSLIFWANIADEVCLGDFSVFGDLVFCYEKHCAVPSIRSALGLVILMPVQSLPN